MAKMFQEPFWGCAKLCKCMKWSRGYPFRLVHPCLGFICSRRWLWLFLLLQYRVGEAAVPGPPVWTIGIANPSGMTGKLNIFDYHPCDIWTVSETHLSYQGIVDFRSQLRWSQSGLKYLVTGHPAAPRSSASSIGSWTGVAVLSLHPTRRAPVQWPPLAFESGRICASVTFCNGLWITGCTIYGTPKGATHSNAREKTDQLLSLGVDRLIDAVGPRFIAGDWNHDLHKFESVQRLHDLGFREIQDLHFERTGCSPQATCRMKTRRDFLFISPEMIPMFRSCKVDDTMWPDHSAVIGTFEGGADQLVRFVWPQPQPIPWTLLPTLPDQPFIDFEQAPDCTAAYRQMWQQVESSAALVANASNFSLPEKCKGRASILAPIPQKVQRAPVKVGRAGEFQPTFVGVDLRHAQFIKQLRRIQSFARLSGSQKGHRCIDEKIYLWQSILRAPGFGDGFQKWWLRLELCVGDPLVVPVTPPEVATAWCFVGVLEREVRRLEKQLIKDRAQRKRQTATDVNALYRAVRRDPPQQVDVLSQHVAGVVSYVDHADCALEFQQESVWMADVPLYVQGQLLTPVMITPDKIWVEHLPQVEVGMSVVQHKGLGCISDLFTAFTEQWNKRWDKHGNVGLDQWSTIVDFAATHFRPINAPSLKHSSALLRATIASKKKSSAKGLDGVDRSDLLNLDDVSLKSILSMYARAHQKGDWPIQALQGSVASLAKVCSPQTVSDFRPITVFSLVYRAWSSMESRHWLRHLEPVLADWLCGNRQACRAMTLWREIIDHVEQAHLGLGHRHGVVFDLEKAFNTVPRMPMMALANLLGVSHDLLVAWSGALSGMERHFKIRQSFSPGLRSTCGVPEGCGLSCLGMLVIDQAFHLWLAQTEKWVVPLTYVDNWEAVVADPNAITQVFAATMKFAESLDLTIDAKKTYVWSTCPKVRKQLRDEGFVVKLHCRDLGAHVVYSQQIANQTTIQRLTDLDDFWKKLSHLRAAYPQKMRLVKTVAWPRAFHAISAVVLGKKRFHSLRAKVMQSLGLDKAGANSFLQLFLDSVNTDPQCHTLLETIRDFREMGCNVEQIDRLTQVGLGLTHSPYNTVSQVLCQRLHQVGLTFLPNGLVQDEIGAFDLGMSDFGEIKLRIQFAWTKVVASNVRHRPDFSGFSQVDAGATRTDLFRRSPPTQGVLRRSVNGTTNTFDVVSHWSDSGTHLCPECNGPDSLEHRLWECPFVSDLRQQMPIDLQTTIASLPPCCRLHGWTVLPGTIIPWLRVLSQIPLIVPPAACVHHEQPILDLFADGSALWPQEQRYRVASWAVVEASPFGLQLQHDKTQIVAAMPLGGIQQSAYRGELFAVLAALTYAVRAGKGVRIWCDCLSVIRKFTLLTDGAKRLKVNGAHFDLWSQILDLVHDIGPSLVKLIKVPAHESLSDATNDFEIWLYYHNQCVDQAAKYANTQRGDDFWKLWNEHAVATNLHLRCGIAVRDFLAQVSQRWVQRAGGYETPEIIRRVPKVAITHLMRWVGDAPLTLKGPKFGKLFGAAFSAKILGWLNNLLDPAQPLIWISFYHLFLHYQLTFKDAGVVLKNGAWYIVDDTKPCFPEQIGFKRLAKSFRLMTQQLLRDCNIDVSTATVRPESRWICCHVGSISMPCNFLNFGDVESWLTIKLGCPAMGQGKTLDSLPLVT